MSVSPCNNWECKFLTIFPNPQPNISCSYFTHSTEIIIWAAKNFYSIHYFNYEEIKKMNNETQMQNVWTISASNGDEKNSGNIQLKSHFNYLKASLSPARKMEKLSLTPFLDFLQLV